jgi:hypothetical protein
MATRGSGDTDTAEGVGGVRKNKKALIHREPGLRPSLIVFNYQSLTSFISGEMAGFRVIGRVLGDKVFLPTHRGGQYFG